MRLTVCLHHCARTHTHTHTHTYPYTLTHTHTFEHKRAGFGQQHTDYFLFLCEKTHNNNNLYIIIKKQTHKEDDEDVSHMFVHSGL